MSKKIFAVLILLCTYYVSKAQNGLEKIIVEKFYISNANDATVNDIGGILPVGSVTYRVYVDMLPGYKFQSCYGSEIPERLLRIETTTKFFNNEDRGSRFPTFNKTNLKRNTLMLDSWVSVGAGCSGHFGVPKYLDNGEETVENTDGVLLNNDPAAGIPLTQQDGLVPGQPVAVLSAGIEEQLGLFEDNNEATTGVFATLNGLWGAAGGSKTADSMENIVLIGQFTTDGDFSFELNIQIGTPTPGQAEQYVAKNPEGNERTIPSLIYPDVSSATEIENLKKVDFTVYPNPSNYKISFEINDVTSSKNYYKIYDMFGAMVESGKLTVDGGKIYKTVDVSHLPESMYLIQLSLDGLIMSSKFIKS
ncbi:MAG: T9SS type A sorting domain-containing protein [Saprospiraceae bacterium]|nr:T9SS type A sorting domain-containing protein [Saprospiraceae bacterium]